MTPPSSTPFTAPMRAPALYVAGFAEQEPGGPVLPVSFRLPCPPSWDDRHPGAWAAERRARRAYFATLDALRTGAIDPGDEAKIGRLLQDLRSGSAQSAIRHFQRILDYVHRLVGRATLPAPTEPMRGLVITVPPPGPVRPAELANRYRWALEWLEARRYVVGKGLRIEWRVRRVTPPAGVSVAAGRPRGELAGV
jgi:hypothetical protein